MTNPFPLPSIDSLVQSLELLPHPEGGYFKQWYQSDLTLSKDLESTKRWEEGSTRSTATAIWYLCPGGGKSSLHAIKSDELWFWHGGSPLIVVELSSSSTTTSDTGMETSTSSAPIVKQTLLGPLGLPGGQSTYIVKGGTYFGAYCPTDMELQQYYERNGSSSSSSSSSSVVNTFVTSGTSKGNDVYALVSCVVAPGFDYRDWEMKSSEELKALYPGEEAACFIRKLAKDV